MSVTVKLGDTIGLVTKILFDGKGRENYWKLDEGKVKAITLNKKGRRVKAEHFYTLDAEEIESNTDWMLKAQNIIVTCEPFILTDELRQRVENWIKWRNNGGDADAQID